MRYGIALLFVLSLLSCQKKEAVTEEETVTATTTTGASPTPTVAPYAAQFEVNSTDYNYGYASAKIYNSNNIAISVDYIKINTRLMSRATDNEYRDALSSSTYTSAAAWEISSNVSDIPDTTLVSPPIPSIGFQKDITKVYDKTKDFTVTINSSGCDSLFFNLGTIVKRIPGRTGITTVTFNPSDNVKFSVTDSTEVDVNVKTFNYSIFTVRGRKWKSISTTTSLSHYKYK